MWEDVSIFGMRSVHVRMSEHVGCQYIWDELVHVGGCQYIWDEVAACGRMSAHLR